MRSTRRDTNEIIPIHILPETERDYFSIPHDAFRWLIQHLVAQVARKLVGSGVNQFLPEMLFDFPSKCLSSLNCSVENGIPFFPKVERGIRLEMEGVQFCPFRVWDYPLTWPFTKHPETSPRLGENDLIRCDFHYGIHVVNELQIKNEDQETDQHPDKINHA